MHRLAPQRDADGVGGSGAGFGENMRVHIFRGLGGAMPEVVGDHPDRQPGIYQERRCRMSEVVDVKVGQAVLTENEFYPRVVTVVFVYSSGLE